MNVVVVDDNDDNDDDNDINNDNDDNQWCVSTTNEI